MASSNGSASAGAAAAIATPRTVTTALVRSWSGAGSVTSWAGGRLGSRTLPSSRRIESTVSVPRVSHHGGVPSHPPVRLATP
jgi:hypothetical protein